MLTNVPKFWFANLHIGLTNINHEMTIFNQYFFDHSFNLPMVYQYFFYKYNTKI